MKCRKCKHKKFKIYDILAEYQGISMHSPWAIEPVYTLICLNCNSTVSVSKRKYIKIARAEGYEIVEG